MQIKSGGLIRSMTAGLFKNGKISDFRSRIQSRRHKRVPLRLEATPMDKYDAGIMQDNNDLSNDYLTVSKKVYFSLHVDHHCSLDIMSHDIDRHFIIIW